MCRPRKRGYYLVYRVLCNAHVENAESQHRHTGDRRVKYPRVQNQILGSEMMTEHGIYLDHSATTPTDPRVLEAMLPYFSDIYGNGSSAHRFGRSAERAIEDARESIARQLNCKPVEIIFTGSGTESDNLALRGAAWARRERGTHLITTQIEHSAILRTSEQLDSLMGFAYSLLPVDGLGTVSYTHLTLPTSDLV